MQRDMTDDQLDHTITGFLAERAQELVAAAVPSHVVAVGIRTRSAPVTRRALTPAMLMVLLLALLIALLAGAGALIGSQGKPSGIGAFSPTGVPSVPRDHHTASALPDGRVLIVGGRGGGTYAEGLIKEAEIWDPRSASFSPAGALATPRFGHTATVLRDGSVLIIGGAGGIGTTRSVEVWDPMTMSFSNGPSLAVGRQDHTATLLPDGRVLVVGGLGDVAEVPSTELRDPTTGSFSVGASLATARFDHTATLLQDGRVLVAGGQVIGDGNQGSDTMLASVEIWDPAAEHLVSAHPMLESRFGHTATLLGDGRVLMVGGLSRLGIEEGMASAEVWDLSTERFSATGAPAYGLAGHTATLLNDGRVLIVGGYEGVDGSGNRQAQLWDPTTSDFLTAGSPSHGFADHGATLLSDGRVLIEGAYVSERWKRCAMSPVPTGHCTISRSGATFAAGAEIFDPAATPLSNASGEP